MHLPGPQERQACLRLARLISQAGCLAALTLVMTAPASAQHPSDDVERTAAAEQICPPGSPTLAVRSGRAAITLDTDGGIERVRGGRTGVCMDDAFFTEGRVTVLAITQNRRLLACGEITAGDVVDLSAPHGVDASRPVEVSIWATVDADEPTWKAQKAALLEALVQQNSTSAEQLIVAQSQIVFANWVWQSLVPVDGGTRVLVDDLRELSRHPFERVWAYAALHDIYGRLVAGPSLRERAELAFVRARLERDELAQDAPSRPALRAAIEMQAIAANPNGDHAERRRGIEDILASATAHAGQEALAHLRALLPTWILDVESHDFDPSPPDADRAAVVIELRALIEQLQQPTTTQAHLAALVSGWEARVMAANRQRHALEDSIENGGLAAEWALGPNLRLLMVHALPARTRENAMHVALGDGEDDLGVQADERVSLMVTGVPHGTTVSLHREAHEVGMLSANLLPVLQVLLPMLAQAANGLRMGPVSARGDGVMEHEAIEALPPLIAHGIQFYDVEGIGRREAATVRLCRVAATESASSAPPAPTADECDADADTIENTLRWRTSRRFDGFTFLLDFGFNTGERAAFGSPRYLAVGPPETGNQLYRLDYDGRRRNQFTISLLAAVRFGTLRQPDLFVFGVGPAFIPKSADGLQIQFDVRLGFRLFPGGYLTVGAGFRQVETPRSERIGSTRIQAVSDTNGAPTLSDTRESLGVVAVIGFSVDLGAVGEQAADWVKAAQAAGGGT